MIDRYQQTAIIRARLRTTRGRWAATAAAGLCGLSAAGSWPAGAPFGLGRVAAAATTGSAAWALRSSGTPPEEGGSMAYDARRGNYVLFDINGVTWTGDGTSWTRRSPTASPPARQFATMAFDGAAVMLFGGQSSRPNPDGTLVALDDTWTWDGTTWAQRITTGAHPPARLDASMATARDGAGPTVVLFGGIVPASQLCSTLAATSVTQNAPVANCDNDPSTWVWTESPAPAWTQYTAPPATAAGLGWPAARSGASMATDAADGHALLFGGFRRAVEILGCVPDLLDARCPTSPLSDTWEWDSARDRWVAQAAPPPGLQARGWAGMASDGGGAILFGGTDQPGSSTVMDDSWQWDGKSASWSGPDLPATSPKPSPRERLAMAADGGGTALIFGGTGCRNSPCQDRLSTPSDASWRWNGSGWSQALVPVPSARDLPSGAFDPVSGRAVLFGGRGPRSDGELPFVDTWTWAGAAWIDASPPTSPGPQNSIATSAAYDAACSCMVLLGGDGETWTWDGRTGTWTQQHPQTSPPARTGAAMAYDAAHGQIVLFGGRASAGGAVTFLADTWTWDGTTWTQQPSPGASPPARQGAAMAFDAAHGQILLFGGVDAGGINTDGSPLGDTWTWNGSSWSQQSPRSAPSPRTRSSLAYDPVTGMTVLFGGAGCPSGDSSCALRGSQSNLYSNLIGGSVPLGDTWSWSGSDWTLESTVAGPAPRAGSLLVFDALRQHLVLFGGDTAPGDTSMGFLPPPGSFVNDTWTLDVAHSTSGAALTPSPLSFGGQGVGMTAAPQVLALTNTGTSTLSIGAISVSGADFAQTNGCPATLSPAAVCAINVTFTPSARGARSGTLSVSDSAGLQTAGLSGVGLPILGADAAALYLQGVTLLAGGTPQHISDGGVCEAGPVHSATTMSATGAGAPGCGAAAVLSSPLGALLSTSSTGQTVDLDSSSAAAHAHSTVASLSLLPGLGVGGADVLDASGLDSRSSASCSSTANGVPASSSSIAGTVLINGTRVATQPVGSRIIFNPTGRNPITLYGNPVTLNPAVARIPMAIVTLNYSRYDPGTNTQVSSPLEVEFPPGGALASVIVGRVFVSYATSSAQDCR